MISEQNVPELRFPEFSGEWKEKKLENIIAVKDGTHDSPKPNQNGYKLITSKNLKDGRLSFEDSYNISEEDYNNINKRSKVDKGDILFGMIGTIGNPVLLEEEGFAIKNVALLKTHNYFGKNYILHYLNSLPIKRQFHLQNTGGTQKFISLSIIRNLKVNLPYETEQKKIGKFFSKLDRLIELEEKKLELLEEQQKGYMQKIFSQELRFRDENGNEYSEWGKEKLGVLGVTYGGLTGKTKEDFGFGESQFITYKNVFDNLFSNEHGVRKVQVKDNEKQNSVKCDDILFTATSETPDEVAMSSLWTYSTENTYLNSFCFGYRLQTKSILPQFLVISLRQEYMRKKLIFLAQGSTRFNISKKEVMKLSVTIPCIEEQKKIIDFFKKLAFRSNRMKIKIEHLKLRKQALLQEMFI